MGRGKGTAKRYFFFKRRRRGPTLLAILSFLALDMWASDSGIMDRMMHPRARQANNRVPGFMMREVFVV
jgi:hypothetical protein